MIFRVIVIQSKVKGKKSNSLRNESRFNYKLFRLLARCLLQDFGSLALHALTRHLSVDLFASHGHLVRLVWLAVHHGLALLDDRDVSSSERDVANGACLVAY